MEENRREVEAFLASVEKRAFRMAQMAVGNREDALDIVQEAMFGWVRRYRHKPDESWKPLFYRVLNSRISDWHRRRRVRDQLRKWFAGPDRALEDAGEDPIEQIPDPSGFHPADRIISATAVQALKTALRRLPLRQRQAFLLRAWEGFSERETAQAMKCTQGSVKTHYSRAMTALRRQMEEYLP